MKTKSTLTIMLGFALLIAVACLTFPKLTEYKPKPAAKFSKMEVKTGHHGKVAVEDSKNIPVHFGLSANFGPKPGEEK